MAIKEAIKSIPIFGTLLARTRRLFYGNKPVTNSNHYWEDRYASGGNSGVGSYSKFADFKAEVLNAFVVKHDVETVIEFGCGDGNQLALANYPNYIGLDVSKTIIAKCREKFSTYTNKTFMLSTEYDGETAELSLSLDVIYHLIENEVFEEYMLQLFTAANRYVIIYASDSDENAEYKGSHVRHRQFTKWIHENMPEWTLTKRIPNKYPYKGDYKTGSFADFYIYKKG